MFTMKSLPRLHLLWVWAQNVQRDCAFHDVQVSIFRFTHFWQAGVFWTGVSSLGRFVIGWALSLILRRPRIPTVGTEVIEASSRSILMDRKSSSSSETLLLHRTLVCCVDLRVLRGPITFDSWPIPPLHQCRLYQVRPVSRFFWFRFWLRLFWSTIHGKCLHECNSVR